jgi:hypothetical protein
VAEFITAGVHCYIDANFLRDANGAQLDVTGWTVEAVARAYYAHGEILSSWSSSPVGDQGQAIAGGAVIDRVRLVVTAAQTSAWDVMFVVVQAEMTSLAGQKSRPIDTVYQIKHEAVI